MKRPASALYTEVCAIPGLAPYHLRASGPGRLDTGEGVFTGVEYEILRKSQGERRSGRNQWGKAITPEAALDSSGRCDLHVRFYDSYRRWHSLYHRVVGLTLLPCFWSVTGKLLRNPRKINHENWEDYQVHHIDGNARNVAVSNLAVVRVRLHARITNCSVKLMLPKAWPYAKGQREVNS